MLFYNAIGFFWCPSLHWKHFIYRTQISDDWLGNLLCVRFANNRKQQMRLGWIGGE